MTTLLVRPLVREVLIGGTAYRVQIATDRLTLTPKGRRKGGIEMTWDALLAIQEHDDETPTTPPTRATPPRSALTEVAQDIRTASTALAKAEAGLVQAGALPTELRAETAPDPIYGRAEQASDWFIEPLLTVKEVASVMRISTRAVRNLELRSIFIAGEQRYRQSDIRKFIQQQESGARRW